ncbi:hypothetical protein MTER_21240 [Mycolicibacter terrae]|uniref:Protein-glutamine gamma-glutamyltransferase-like C-terminal domain-containing protein n=1 Tax=Mycolicibacter terrae TaxID=1788 RepID=A0AAD1HXX2_9MYCO|nr:DUF4129 domain-containing protein [Mycolicibacter terrae]ORW97550.1 hypothetical protein AWC28_09265 [Mycolicibacter terrae]BBX22713.1 hypothetical protein MTER_21240 [Mycolicibacter terrae]SNV72476.1 Uncharacterised protein [Mycolicibacter terrae]
MAAAGRTTGPVIALIMLLLVAGAATRGYLPGGEHVAHRPAASGPLEPIILAALLAVSVGAVAVAVVQRARHRLAVPGSMGTLSRTAGARRGKPAWRVLLIGLAAVALWLLAVVVLARLGGVHRFAVPAGFFGQHGDVPGSPDAPQSPAPTPLHPLSDGARGELLGSLLVVTAALLVLIAAAVFIARARRTRPRSPATGVATAAGRAPSAGETLARAAELGLTRIADRSREPREAIIACYAVMERHLADVPDAAPREFDTPTEVLARAVEHHALPAENASRLVELFTEARFSPHLMTERHRADAEEILRLVLAELRAPT